MCYNSDMSRFKVHSGDSNGYSPPTYSGEMKLAKIDVASEESLAKWESVLHLSRKELLEAIGDFGPVVRDIRAGLLSRRQNDAA